MAYYSYFVFLFLSWVLFSEFGCARNYITTNQSLRDPDTLESSDGSFKFGFFSLIKSTDRYIGIWYNKKVRDTLEVIWVANRENPLNDSSGVIQISRDGNLQLLDGQNKSIWSSNVTLPVPKNEVNNSSCVAQLRDDGNLVLHADVSGDNVVWQSVDHLTNSLLRNMKLRFDENHTTTMPIIASWKSASDPSVGQFTAGFNHRSLPELFVWDGKIPYWRSGPLFGNLWYGNMFLGVRAFYRYAQDDEFQFEKANDGTLSISFSSTSKTEHYVLNYDGQLMKRYYMEADGGDWLSLWRSLESDCDIYGKCGDYGSCNITRVPICSCLHGFEPWNDQEWDAGNWTSGCKPKKTLQCGTVGGEDDVFFKHSDMKVPDNAAWLYSNDVYDCRKQCLENCTCLAYAYYPGLGCMVWNETLIDIQEFSYAGVDLFIRLAHSDIVEPDKPQQQKQQGKASKSKKVLILIVTIGTATFSVIVYCVWRRMCQRNGVTRIMRKMTLLQRSMSKDRTTKVEVGDLPVFELEKLAIATNHFQDINKLGRGGFGVVYKGILEDGQEIAVKRLSKASGQGLKEFMTEVLVISKLQHRNLVKLLGCCIGEEKLLVYEYMPNKSLDALLFDPAYQKILDWKRRVNIMLGICRGLLYLHRDSRLRIIHRDLKASNILLDGNLNPKISDFGMARIFGANEDQGDTKRIVGTYGYMSPEYAMEGRFSEKSDVFSLGVLLLEIVSGRRNNSFKDEDSLSLLGHAWNLLNEGNILSLIDPAISKSTFHAEILKCVQLGLLCVQEFPDDRPSVSMVISMIETEVTDLPYPSQPGFTQKRVTSHYEAQIYDHENGSVNPVSISALSGR